MLTFNENNMVLQRFAFPAPIMDYLFKNLRPEHLLKLFQTCKFFYAKFHLSLIQNLVIAGEEDDESFGLAKAYIRASNPLLQKLQDSWITESFIYRGPINPGVIPSFNRCIIKRLELRDYITWEEFVTLTKAGNIKDLMIKGVLGEQAGFASVEEIVAQVPKATSIQISDGVVTRTTFATLATMDRQIKISSFILGNVLSHNIQPQYNLIKDFLRNHAANDCNIRFVFKLMAGDDDATFQQNFLIKQREGDFNLMVDLALTHVRIFRQQQEILKRFGLA